MKKNQTQWSTTHTYYLIVMGTWNYKGEEYASSYCREKFKSMRAAKMYWKENYKNRNKQDGWDEHYNQLPFIVEKITEKRELIK